MNFSKIISGGFFSGRRTCIVSGVGILSAVAAYLAGDENIFNAANAVFTLGGIYFLRRSIKQTKRKTECKSRKNSKTKTEH